MISKDMLVSFRKDFKEAVKQLEQQYGVEIKLGNISYNTNNFHGKMEVFEISDGKNAEQLQFEKLCSLYGYKPSDYGREFVSQGDRFKLVGFKPQAQKFPYIGLRSDGKRFKFHDITLV